jgi:hypothetical protein
MGYDIDPDRHLLALACGLATGMVCVVAWIVVELLRS